MRAVKVEEARQHIEQQIRVLAYSAEARAEEAERHAAEADDPDTKRFWAAQAKSARKIAVATHAECDELLRQLPTSNAEGCSLYDDTHHPLSAQH